jgi:hypothetical protein
VALFTRHAHANSQLKKKAKKRVLALHAATDLARLRRDFWAVIVLGVDPRRGSRRGPRPPTPTLARSWLDRLKEAEGSGSQCDMQRLPSGTVRRGIDHGATIADTGGETNRQPARSFIRMHPLLESLLQSLFTQFVNVQYQNA